jgi:hypothetical protein
MHGGVLRAIRGAFIVLRGMRIGNLYFLDGSTVTGTTTISKSLEDDEADNSRLWHMRLGHAGEKALQGLVKQGLLKGVKIGKHGFCEHCVLGKQTRVKFGTAVYNIKGILDYVYTNIWGPSKHESLGGNHWFVTFIDDFSRRVWVYMMKHKDEVLDIFLKWKKMVETQTGKRVKTFRSDNSGEYTSDPFFEVC